MLINRRHLVAGAAVAGATAALPLGRVRAQEASGGGDMRTQAPAYRRMTLGDWVVTAVADGGLTLPPEALPNASQEQWTEAMEAAFLETDGYRASVNTFLLQNGDATILVDAGGSKQMMETLGNVTANLAAAGVSPSDIDTILLTHMHSDHIGGLADPSGAAVFPNAEIVVRDRELAFWTDPAEASRIPEMQRGTVEVANVMTSAYEGRITPFADDVVVVDGIEAVALYGHTPGHTGYRLSGGGETLLIWGDVMHVAPVQMPRPEIYIGFDVTPEEAVATREALLKTVADERMMIAGMHMAFPGFGHVGTDGEGYRFVPARWQYTL